MKIRATASAIPRHRFPVDPWRLVETELDHDDLGHTESLFAIGNGYIGMRANPSEGREAHSHGTFLNGFHETWPIQHAEAAVAFATTGQTIVNVPDAKLMKLYVDDEPLLLREADLESYERVMDFRTGISHRDLVWTTPAGKRLRVRSERMVSLEHRHLAVMRFEIEMLEGSAPVVISSQLLNRQDGEDEYHVEEAALGEGVDPRQRRTFRDRVLLPQLQRHDEARGDGGDVVLGYRCANSGMTLACAYHHEIETACDYEVETEVGEDLAKTVFTVHAVPGEVVRITKFVSYHSSRGHPGPGARPTAAGAPSSGRGAPGSPGCTRSSGPGSMRSGTGPTSASRATTPPSRRSGGTCSSWRRRPAGPTSRASRRRG